MGAWYGGPVRAEKGEGSLPPGEVGLSPVQRREGQALPCPRLPGPYACVRRRPASSRCTRGGGGGGEAGRREPTTKLASVAERTARLEWKEPTPAERSRDSGERRRPAGRSRYRAQAAGWAEGRDLAGQRTRTSRAGMTAPAAGPEGPRIWPPQSEPYPEGAAEEICLRGRDPPRSRPGRGLFSSPAGGWSQPRPLPLRTSGKNLRADGRGEWKGAGRRQGT